MSVPVLTEPIEQLSRVDDVNYPEFAAKLISGTFDAIVSSMIRQQEAYADPVEGIAMSLDGFAAEAVTGSEVQTYLRTHFPGDEENGASVGTPASPGDLTRPTRRGRPRPRRPPPSVRTGAGSRGPSRSTESDSTTEERR